MFSTSHMCDSTALLCVPTQCAKMEAEECRQQLEAFVQAGGGIADLQRQLLWRQPMRIRMRGIIHRRRRCMRRAQRRHRMAEEASVRLLELEERARSIADDRVRAR